MAITIQITPKIRNEEKSGVPLSPTENQTTESLSVEEVAPALASFSLPNISSMLTPAFAIIAAKKAVDIAIEVREKIIDIEKDNRLRTEQLRKMGGGNFTPNQLGERYNIFTESYVGGIDVSYRRR
jgi:hypothetical protein